MANGRRVILLGAVAVAVIIAATALAFRQPSAYFPAEGRTELGLPMRDPAPVLLRIYLLEPNEGDTVEVTAVRPKLTEGTVAPEALLYDAAGSMRLIGMIAEHVWDKPPGAILASIDDAGPFGAGNPQQIVFRVLPGDTRVTLGPVEVDFRVNGGNIQTQVFEVYARACFGQSIDNVCRPPAEDP